MFLSRLLCPDGRVALALRQGSEAALVRGNPDLGELVAEAAAGLPLATALLRRGLGDPVDVAALLAEGRVLAPLPAGPLALWPESAGEDRLRLTLADPGAGLGIAAGGALEGGAAALVVAGRDGRALRLGWVQTHTGLRAGAEGGRCLSCGPELCLNVAEVPAGGHARVFAGAVTLTEFDLPQSGRGQMPALPDRLAEGVTLLRLSRWLLRPAAAHLDGVVESRVAGLGLPLRNPLGAGAALALTGADAERRQA
jgi:hypothetical protein